MRNAGWRRRPVDGRCPDGRGAGRAAIGIQDGCRFLLPAVFEPVEPSYGFADAVGDLRAALGGPFVDFALAARATPAPTGEPAPAALMPVWPFETDGEGDDVLVSSATLWGANLFVQALRVEDEDDPTPVAAVLERFASWVAAAGRSRLLEPVHPPLRTGCYVVSAASAPL